MRLGADRVSVTLGTRPVLDGVSLSVSAGEMVAVIGPNGAGKSTLLRSLAGLITPNSGSVRVDGRSLAGLPRAQLARAIAYLPQDRTVHWPLTVDTIVGLGRIPYGSRPGALGARDKTAVQSAIAALDLVGLAERPATELSGGELARVLLARALAQEAEILLADEPTAGLDPAHQLALFDKLRAMTGEDKAVVIALHDLSHAARFCDRIVVLKQGRVLADGTPATVLTSELLASVYGIRARLVHIDGMPLVISSSELHVPPA